MSEPGSPLKMIISRLSEEEGQETLAKDKQSSYVGFQHPDILREREREYRDVEKHFVRRKWLDVARDIVKENGRPITYLTLPALYRLDVSLLHRENLVRLTERPEEEPILEVAGFETDPTRHGRMSSVSPRLRLFGLTQVEKAILRPENPYFDELLRMFPFDVVNLDLTTSLTPQHEGPYSETMQAIDEVLRRQSIHGGKWGMFLTFRNVKDEWEQNALNKFLDNLQANIDEHPTVRDAFGQKYQVISVEEFFAAHPNKSISQAVVKWVIDRCHAYSVRLVTLQSFYYTRYEAKTPYVISKLLMTFVRGAISPLTIPTKTIPAQVWMNEDLVACIKKHGFADVENILYEAGPGRLSELETEVAALCALIDDQAGSVT